MRSSSRVSAPATRIFASGWQTIYRKHLGPVLAQRQGFWFYDMAAGWFDPPEIRDDMVKTMWFKAGVFRNGPDLEAAAKELSVLEDQYKNCYVGDTSHVYNTAYEQYVELGNLLQISQAIVQGAIARKESRGAHTRRDYPKRDDQNFLKHTLVFKEDGKYRFEYKDVVVTKYEPKERKY